LRPVRCAPPFPSAQKFSSAIRDLNKGAQFGPFPYRSGTLVRPFGRVFRAFPFFLIAFSLLERNLARSGSVVHYAQIQALE
jgi:hypothetical protein